MFADSAITLSQIYIHRINCLNTWVFQGHDTTASAISWILYSLATHADIQDKAQAEIDAILDGKDSEVIDW